MLRFLRALVIGKQQKKRFNRRGDLIAEKFTSQIFYKNLKKLNIM